MSTVGGFEIVEPGKNPGIVASLSPVPVNPDGRYLIARSELAGTTLARETRFGMPVRELLSSDAIASADNATDTSPGEALKPGDTLACLNYGFVEFADVMGTDDDIANAARTSYTGGKSVRANEGLIRYLLRHHHTTPFEMGELKIRLYIPIFVYRQLFRHRTASQLEPEVADCISNDTAFQAFSVQNEMSGRYVEMPDHYYVPELAAIQRQSTDNKQGRSADGITADERVAIRARFVSEIKAMRAGYQASLKDDLAKELARANLPLSQYTLLVWKIDLKNLLHFIALRLHPHAQYEVREFARALYAVVQSTFPIAASAFDDYMLGGVRLTRTEAAALAANVPEEHRMATYKAFCKQISNKRERAEFAEKLGLDPAALE